MRPRAAERHGGARLLAGLPGHTEKRRQGSSCRECWPGCGRGSRDLVPRTVRAERRRRPAGTRRPCRLSQRPGSYPEVHACAAEPRGGEGRQPAFFDMLREETHPAVRVVLGHFLFVYIHPYMDGNGRVGRLLMDTMMASGGYPWTIIPVSDRNAYVNALEKASVGEDIVPFADLLAGLVKKGLAGESLPKVPKSS